MIRTRIKLVPFALCAIGAVACLFSGCEKASEPAEPLVPQTSSMSDPAFLKDLDNRRRERQDLSLTRNRLAAQMQKMVEEVRAKMPQADDAAVKAALDRDAEWISLNKRVEDLDKAIDENRQRAIKVVRDQMNSDLPKTKKVSK